MLVVLIFIGLLLGFLSVFWLSPLGVPVLKERAGGQMPLDLRCAYSPKDAYALIDSYGLTGIAHWRRLLFLDLVFPAVYATLGIVWTRWGNFGEPWRLLIVLFLSAAAFSDYLENFCLLYFLKALPRHSDTWVRRASVFTSAKFCFFAATSIVCFAYWITTILPPA